MFKKIQSSAKEIGFLTIALTLALCANFAFGAWSNPPASPPNSNVAAPINISSATQAKTGTLGVTSLNIVAGTPDIKLLDSNAADGRIAQSEGRTFIQYQNSSGGWDNSAVFFQPGSTEAADYGQKYARVYGQMRANTYCDESGNNCVDASAGPAQEIDPQVGTINAGKWCRANSAGSAITCNYDAPSNTSSYRWITGAWSPWYNQGCNGYNYEQEIRSRTVYCANDEGSSVYTSLCSGSAPVARETRFNSSSCR